MFRILGTVQSVFYPHAIEFPFVRCHPSFFRRRPLVFEVVVVGRLGQGLAKPGKSAPWVLNAPSADDLKTAEKYEAYASSQKAAQEEPF